MPTAEQTKTVRVSAAAAPFSARRTVCEFPEHTTVRQIVAKLRQNLRGLRVNVLSKGRIISQRHWDRPIKGGELIEIRIVLAGGGGDGGKGGLPGALQNFLRFYAEKMPFTPLGFSTRVMTSFAGGITGGVAPPPDADLGNLSGTAERHSETLFLRGTRNQSRPFSAIPRVLGRHKIVPAYAMEPYTIDKDEQFMRVLFDLGYGMLLIDDIKIGDTPIDSFSEVEYETRFGSDDDPAITLIRDQVREEDLAVKLNEDEDVIRTTEPDTDAISVDFHWPRGLVHVEDNGEYDEIETRIRIQYALAGTNNWKNAPDQDDLEDGVAEIEGSSTKPIVKNFQWNVPRGQYDVKITRLNQEAPDDDEEEADRYFEDVYWTKLRSERRAAPITRTGTARIAISIQASEQLNNVVDELSCVVWSVVADLGAHQIRFDGGSEHLRAMMSGQNVTGANPRTYEWWMLVETDIAETAGVFEDGHSNGANADFCFRLQSKATETWRLDFGGGTVFDFAIAGSVDGAWHHWAITYDGSTVRLMYDGVDVANWLVALDTDADRLRIAEVDGSRLRGRIRDFRKWNVARSEAQIAANKDTVYTGLPGETLPAGIISLYPMHEGRGLWCIDLGPQRNHLRHMNTPSWHDMSGSLTKYWALRPSSNPASLYREILQGSANKRPVADARLDLEALADWHAWNETKGNECNFVIDFKSTTFERLRHVASTGLASFTMRDGLYSVVIDRQQSDVVQHFTPRNSWGFEGRKAFREVPTALKIRFVNENEDWQQDTRTVFDDGYDEESADNVYEDMELPGITNPDQVWKHGRHHIAVAKLRPETYELNVDVEHLVCTRGDLVKVTHDVMLVGLGWGRVKAVHRNGSNEIIAIAFDEKFTMEAAKTYQVTIRAQDGSSYTHTLVTEEGEWNTLRLAAATDDNINVGDLGMYGESGTLTSNMIVKSIEPGENLSARLTLVDESPGIYTAADGEIPEYNPNITLPPDEQRKPPAPTITRIVSDETALLRDGDGAFVVRAMLELSFQNGSFAPPDRVQVQHKIFGSSEPWTSSPWLPLQGRLVYVRDVQERQYYAFRVRTVSKLGQVSGWSADHSNYIIGKTSPPPAVQDLFVTQLPGGMRKISWSIANQPPDYRGVKLRFKAGTGHAWEDLQDLGDAIYTTTPVETARPSSSGVYTFGVKAVDYSGNESTEATLVEVTLGNPPLSDLYLHVDARELGWPGTLSGPAVVIGGKYIESGSAYTWDSAQSLGDTWADLESAASLWGGGEFTYTHPVIDLGRRLLFMPGASWNFKLHGSATIEERHSDDNISYSSWDTVGAAAVTARYVQFRIRVTSAPTEAETLTDFRMEIRTQQVQEHIVALDTSTITGAGDIGVGDIRLPIARTFAAITSVQVIFHGDSSGWGYEVVDLDTIDGPEVKLRSGGTLTDTTIDAIVYGFE